MAHGYMREYDEDYRGEDRERSKRDWRSDDDRRWRDQDRDRGMMFGSRQERDDGRGFFDRLGDRARESFRDDDDDHRRWGRSGGHGRFSRQLEDRGAWENNRDWPNRDRSSSFGGESGYGQGQESRRFSSHPDDHYRSWRDKQMQSLDRDYEDYCREREQQFHSDFDSWRQQRGNPGPLRTGMTQTGLSMDPSGATQAEAATDVGSTPPDPMDTATLGTTPRSRTKN